MHGQENVGEVLLRIFPKLRTDERQRQSAARWMGIILLYFKLGWKAQDVAEKLNISEKKVYDTAQRITRAGAGLRTTGKQRSGRRGRPKIIRF
jgi:transposase